MENNVTHLGLDVHKDSIAVAVLRPGKVEPDQRVIANTPDALRKLIARVSDRSSLVACYEAGPTGYGTQRLLASLNVSCDVIAPSLVPKRSGDLVKTDRLDARNLARLHRAGGLTAIRVPTAEEEALRDLVRLREDLKDDRRRMQHRIKSFLLRHDRRCPDHRRGWSRRYRLWVSAQRFDDPNTQLAFDHPLAALNMRTVQLDDIDRQLGARQRCVRRTVTRSRACAPFAASTRCLHSQSPPRCATSDASLRAPSFMGFTGLVPSEHSSGLRERRGSITKTGNAHLRRVLVEAAWSYRHKPYVRPAMAERFAGQPPNVVAYSWQAQVRLHDRFRSVAARKNRNVAAVAVARELAGFVWGLMNERTDAV